MGHIGDLNFGLTAFDLNDDGDYISVIVRDDGAAACVGSGDHRVGKFGLVEIGDFFHGVGALRV